ncbi:SCP-like protein [Subdoligranulum variabile DSM 15176]|uniref:SCP-like protein n=2 Tax=Subdoligranulum variabile TaxID=214851 RepID=D1PRU8_9FIRM|nr:SCP-like protein [Subdoligranulum variabile DSM 15176]
MWKTPLPGAAKGKEQTMHFAKKLTVLTLAAALLLTGCGTSITGVSLSLPDTMERGTTAAATTEYAYSGATPEQAAAEKLADKLGLSWTSSDPSVVAVSADGTLSAVNAGTAEVALSSADGKLSASGTITVVVSPTALTMPETLTLTVGEEPQSAAATVEPADATDQTVTYSSSDDSIAAVDAAGLVTPVAAGEATITATLGDLEARCTVTVEEMAAEEEAPSESGEATSSGTTAQSGGAASGSTESGAAAQAPAASTAYGAIPFDLAKGSGIWWYIDSSDSAYSAVVENINAYRAAVGVPALTVDSGLSEIAKSRCSSMVDTGLTHDGAQTTEIIGQNASSAQAIVDAWANSTDHYNAMVSTQFTKCGVGCYFNEYGWTYWCVTFG